MRKLKIFLFAFSIMATGVVSAQSKEVSTTDVPAPPPPPPPPPAPPAEPDMLKIDTAAIAETPTIKPARGKHLKLPNPPPPPPPQPSKD